MIEIMYFDLLDALFSSFLLKCYYIILPWFLDGVYTASFVMVLLMTNIRQSWSQNFKEERCVEKKFPIKKNVLIVLKLGNERKKSEETIIT